MKIFYCKQNDVCASDIQNNLFLPSAKTRKVTGGKKPHKNSINWALFSSFREKGEIRNIAQKHMRIFPLFHMCLCVHAKQPVHYCSYKEAKRMHGL
mgnify:CR=1 FL=1